MKVYTILHGEKHEGGHIVGVYSTHEEAVRKALMLECHFKGGWTPIEDEPDNWENGCDFVEVRRWEVGGQDEC